MKLAKNPNLKKMGGWGKKVWGVWGSGGLVVSDFFLTKTPNLIFFLEGYKLTKNPNLKKKTFFFHFWEVGGGGGGGGRKGWGEGEQMFQKALLLFKENNCVKLFWYTCINVEIMARSSSISDLTFKCDLDLQLFSLPKNVSNSTTTSQGEHLCKTILKSMHICRSDDPEKLLYVTLKCDLDLQPT